MNGGKGSWYLLTGLLIGLGLGLIYAWLIEPVEYIDTAPHSLSPAIKERYRSLISLAYQADGDIGRAQQRLELLQDNNSQSALAAQAQQEVANGGSPQEAQALALLAEDINQSGAVDQSTPAAATSQPAIGQPAADKPTAKSRPAKTATLEAGQAVRSPTPRPTATDTPEATFTPRVTAVVQATLGPPFALKDKKKVCDPSLPNALLQVEVEDGSNQPVAGVRLDVTWNGGEDFFFTGLYPRITNGYADFEMSPGVTYSLRAGEGGQTVSGLTAPTDCKKTDGTVYTGGWMLTFTQP
ncbi:MAG: hypothetical protein P4L50_21530 [Anaerolineaceae bacterium]|nr:hypothetical protein [Anaerolineaceae bacterium]